MKKIERAKKFVNDHLQLFRCPRCQSLITEVDQTSIICAQGHRIDFNKHGYLHLMANSGATEYQRQLFVDRRSLLQAGLFQPIVQEINNQLPHQPLTILDVGTGEGTPLQQLATFRQQADTFIGFDIAKEGVNLATQLPVNAFFCVADLRQLPFNNDQFDVVMELFSPSDYQEFHRVIKPGGQLIKVIPNANYLVEIRHLLYGKDDQHYHYDNRRVKDLFKQHYPNAQVINVKYQFRIPNGLQFALIGMTPLHWGKNAVAISSDQAAQLKSVTVDVSLLIGSAD